MDTKKIILISILSMTMHIVSAITQGIFLFVFWIILGIGKSLGGTTQVNLILIISFFIISIIIAIISVILSVTTIVNCKKNLHIKTRRNLIVLLILFFINLIANIALLILTLKSLIFILYSILSIINILFILAIFKNFKKINITDNE